MNKILTLALISALTLTQGEAWGVIRIVRGPNGQLIQVGRNQVVIAARASNQHTQQNSGGRPQIRVNGRNLTPAQIVAARNVVQRVQRSSSPSNRSQQPRVNQRPNNSRPVRQQQRNQPVSSGNRTPSDHELALRLQEEEFSRPVNNNPVINPIIAADQDAEIDRAIALSLQEEFNRPEQENPVVNPAIVGDQDAETDRVIALSLQEELNRHERENPPIRVQQNNEEVDLALALRLQHEEVNHYLDDNQNPVPNLDANRPAGADHNPRPEISFADFQDANRPARAEPNPRPGISLDDLERAMEQIQQANRAVPADPVQGLSSEQYLAAQQVAQDHALAERLEREGQAVPVGSSSEQVRADLALAQRLDAENAQPNDEALQADEAYALALMLEEQEQLENQAAQGQNPRPRVQRASVISPDAQCCVCMNNSSELGRGAQMRAIPCENGHRSDVICTTCIDQVRNCPICRGPLGA